MGRRKRVGQGGIDERDEVLDVFHGVDAEFGDEGGGLFEEEGGEARVREGGEEGGRRGGSGGGGARRAGGNVVEGRDGAVSEKGRESRGVLLGVIFGGFAAVDLVACL